MRQGDLSSGEQRDTLRKVGTLAHNRSFTRREFGEYGGTPREWEWLRRRGVIVHNGGHWYPTADGWARIEKDA